jgi:hypothetical protein
VTEPSVFHETIPVVYRRGSERGKAQVGVVPDDDPVVSLRGVKVVVGALT